MKLFLFIFIFLILLTFISADAETFFASGDNETMINFLYLPNQTVQENTTSTNNTTTTTSGGGGSSGGGGLVQSRNIFTVDKTQISVTLVPGQVKTEEITITNIGNDVISVDIENLFRDFVIRGEDVLLLNPGESRTVKLNIFSRIETVPDLYLGKVIIKSGDQTQEILIAVEVESKGVLLDVRAKILDPYRKVLPGGEVLSEIRLFNLGDTEGRRDVLIVYEVRDRNNNKILEETESLAIETQTTFIKELHIPEDTREGNYVFYVQAIYNEKTASATDNFEVVLTIVTPREKIYIVTIILLAILLAGIIYHLATRKRGKIKEIGLSDITKK